LLFFTDLFISLTGCVYGMADNRVNILLIDDDESLNDLVEQYLTGQGFAVTTITDGTSAAASIVERNPDLVILDVMLPGTDGLSICRQVRPEYDGPVLMLTALGDDIDEVAGLETGADDYLSKPVRPRVLLARIRALLRRHQRTAASTAEGAAVSASAGTDVNSGVNTANGGSSQSVPSATPIADITIGDITISRGRMSVSNNGQAVNVTDAEFDLLYLLASRAGQLLSRDDINRELRGLEHDGIDRTIDLRISRLRRKLGDDSKEPQIIKSVRGKGYLFAL
jgi:DNA-binding response OmpR family regulator